MSSPLAAPLIVGTRLRKGSANSARGAARLVADAIRTARAAGAGGPQGTGLIVLRADSAFYGYPVIAAARRAGAHFSVTARASPTIARTIESITESAWQPIHYPHAVWDEQAQALVSDAEIAEVPFTAFTGRRKAEHITSRLLVRRVRRLNTGTSKTRSTSKTSKGDSAATSPEPATQQGELFATYRYHAVFTDSPLTLVQAEKHHRGHAIIEQVHADLRSGPLAHLPSGSFAANSAWLVLAAIAFNLTRAAGCLASTFHAKATTGTIRTQLINIPTRLARSARRLRLHLPERWPWKHAWQQLFQATLAPAPS